MKTAFLKHISESDHGTFGVFACPAVGFSCFSLELPWKENRVRISRISDGEYIVRIRRSPKFGITFHITGVDGRTYILIHSLNYAGDTSKGWKTHSHGCIGFGKSKGFLNNQRAILNSRLAVTEFQRLMNNETFKLIIS